MAKMNKVVNPQEMSKITQQFTQEHTKLNITDEMSMYEISCHVQGVTEL